MRLPRFPTENSLLRKIQKSHPTIYPAQLHRWEGRREEFQLFVLRISASTDFLTYAKLFRMSKKELSDLHCDLIVLDEFHRCGADVWGKGVQRLLDSHPRYWERLPRQPVI